MRFSFKGLSAFLVTFAALLLLHLPLLGLPYHWDEAGYYIPAALDFYRSWLLIPKTTLSVGHSPLVMVYLGLVWHLFGYSVWAARAAGAGHVRILLRHITPNVLPLSFLYAAIGVQAGVMLEAALSFLGYGDPNAMSWGTMLNAAFQAGAMRTAWWWVLPPGLALSLFVVAIFMITRAYEELLNPRLRVL